jgi:hypothetical protein
MSQQSLQNIQIFSQFSPSERFVASFTGANTYRLRDFPHEIFHPLFSGYAKIAG